MLPRTLDAVIVHLMNRYFHRPAGEEYVTTNQGRDNRNFRLPNEPEMSNLQRAHAQDSSYTVTNDGDPRSLLDIIKECLDEKAMNAEKNAGAQTTIIDTLVSVLYLPRPANHLTVPSIQALQEALLRPDEQTVARFVESTKGTRCQRCGHALISGEAVTFLEAGYIGDATSAVVCGGCQPSNSVKCAHAECATRIVNVKPGTMQYCPAHDGKPIEAKPKKTAAPRAGNRFRGILDEAEVFRVNPVLGGQNVVNVVPTPDAPQVQQVPDPLQGLDNALRQQMEFERQVRLAEMQFDLAEPEDFDEPFEEEEE